MVIGGLCWVRRRGSAETTIDLGRTRDSLLEDDSSDEKGRAGVSEE